MYSIGYLIRGYHLSWIETSTLDLFPSLDIKRLELLEKINLQCIKELLPNNDDKDNVADDHWGESWAVKRDECDTKFKWQSRSAEEQRWLKSGASRTSYTGPDGQCNEPSQKNQPLASPWRADWISSDGQRRSQHSIDLKLKEILIFNNCWCVNSASARLHISILTAPNISDGRT